MIDELRGMKKIWQHLQYGTIAGHEQVTGSERFKYLQPGFIVWGTNLMVSE
jgi:hypothetical protein